MVEAKNVAGAGFQYLGRSYEEMDCQKFVEACLQDAGIQMDLKGANAWYRKIRNEGWVGTPEECRKRFGCVPAGAFLFIHAFDGGEEKRGYHDGLGNASHIGLRTDRKMGAIHSSESRGGVFESSFTGRSINGGWNCVGLWNRLSYGEKIDALMGTTESAGSAEPVLINRRMRVSGGGLNLRLDPDKKNGKRICTIPSGTELTVEIDNGEWCRVIYQDKVGWVMSKFLDEVAASEDAQEEFVRIPRALANQLSVCLNNELGDKG